MSGFRICLFVGVLLAGWGAPSAAPRADDPAPDRGQGVVETTTRHSVAIAGTTLAYTVKVGTIGLPEEGGPTAARLVYTSYTLDGADPAARPLSFIVNGGPGASSAYLHLGALGPVRLVFGPDGRAPSPPSRLNSNANTWLAFSDLVFIDPVGTGFSRASGGEDEGHGNERDYWRVDKDLSVLGGFVRRFLTVNERWRSPKVLVGESYGGFRMAALASRLPKEFGVGLNGIVLISPALEFELQGGSDWDLLPWVLRVPSMAAVARAQGKAEVPGPPDGAQDLSSVEEFALGPLLVALAGNHAGRDDPPAFAMLASYIGLEQRIVTREHGRISARTFSQKLLESEGQRVSLYDGRLATSGNDDTYLPQITAAIAGGLADYVRTELGVGVSMPYLVLNQDVFRRWGWQDEGRQGHGRVGSADELADALAASPTLRVLVAHGRHDLVTPYLASVYLVDQLVTEPEARARVQVKVYPGGHMFYTQDDSLAAFTADAAALFGEITAPLAGG